MLKKIREQKKYTQEELSKKINESVQNISRYENGKRIPNYNTLEKIAIALKLKTKEQIELHSYFAEIERKRKEN